MTYIQPTTIKEAEKIGYQWLSRFNSPCDFCSTFQNDTQSIATYGKNTTGGKNLAYFCEDCGKAQGLKT